MSQGTWLLNAMYIIEKKVQFQYQQLERQPATIFMHYALFAHEKLALLGLSCNAFPDAYSPRPHCLVSLLLEHSEIEKGSLTMQHAIPIIERFRRVNNVFVGVAKYRPLFM